MHHYMEIQQKRKGKCDMPCDPKSGGGMCNTRALGRHVRGHMAKTGVAEASKGDRIGDVQTEGRIKEKREEAEKASCDASPN